jgi:hypothetical protein
MPQLPSEWLRDMGLAEFTPSAVRDIEAYGHAWSERHDIDPDQFNPFQAFIELGAVEFALVPMFGGSLRFDNGVTILERVPRPDRVVFPVQVTDRDAAYAIYKTDCGPFQEHKIKGQGELKSWDVFAFAGDMSKAELIGFSEDINVLAEPESMRSLMQQMANRYMQAGVGDRIVESGLLAAQGIVWFAKLALLRGEVDYVERSSSFINMAQPLPQQSYWSAQQG